MKSPSLIIDTCTPLIQVGVLRDGRWLSNWAQTGGALESLFSGVDSCLHEAQLPLSSIGQFLYARGPGSLLGIRIAALALQTWQQVHEQVIIYGYSSLELAQRIVEERLSPEEPFNIWTETTQGRCLWAEVKASAMQVTEHMLPTGPVTANTWRLQQRPSIKSDYPTLPYEISAFPECFNTLPLIRLSKGEDCVELSKGYV